MKRTPLLVVIALVFVPAVSMAEQYQVWVSGETPGYPSVRINTSGVLANHQQVLVGSVSFSGELGVFDAYCVDLNHYISPNTGPYAATLDLMSNWPTDPTLPTPNSPANAGTRAAFLFNTFGELNALNGYTSDQQRWALQVAIWNALYDADLDVLAGSFFIDNFNISYAGVTAANAMLQALAGYSGSADATWLRLPNNTSGGTQDFIARVPEPGTLLLLGAGFFGIAWAARRLRAA